MEKFKLFNKSANALLFCFAVNSAIDLFIYTFFTAHMLTISGNDIAFIAKFYMLVYAFLGLGYFALVPLVKKINTVIFVRIGAVLKAGFILLVVVLGDSILTHYIWLGALYGLCEAVFWSGGNTAKNLVVESNKIKNYISMISVNARIIGIVFPILFGVSIDAVSFEKIAILVLGLNLVQIISTLLIKPQKIQNQKTSYKNFFQKVKETQYGAVIKYSYLIVFLRGLQYFIPTFITYLIIYVLKTNTSLGLLTTLAAIMAIIILLAFNYVKKLNTNIWLYILFALGEGISLLLSSAFMMVAFIVVFQFVHTINKTTIDALSESMRGTSIRDAHLDEFLPESMGISELCLNSGRIIGFFMLFILGIVDSFVAVIIISSVFVVFLSMYNIGTGIIEKKISRLAVEKTETKNIAKDAEGQE